MRKTWHVLLIVLILAAVGAGFWYWQKNSPSTFSKSSTYQKTNQTSDPIQYLTQTAVADPVLSLDAQSVWYFDKNGQELYRLLIQDPTDLTRYDMPDHPAIQFVLWPDRSSDFIIGTPSGKYLYDSAEQKFVKYDEKFKYVTWLPGGGQIIYVWSDGKRSTLSISNSDTANFQSLTDLPKSDFHISVSPNGQSFVLYTASGNDPLYFVVKGLNVLERLGGNVGASSVQFAPAGGRIAYVSMLDGKKDLSVLTLESKQVKTIGQVGESESFLWSDDGTSVYWVDQNKRLQKADAVSGNSENLSAGADLKLQSIYPGQNGRLLFIEADSGRLGILNTK